VNNNLNEFIRENVLNGRNLHNPEKKVLLTETDKAKRVKYAKDIKTI